MRKFLFLIGAASMFGLSSVSAAQAAPVTAADFSGKKICWGGGSISSYGRGGQYSNNLTGDGTWSLSGGSLHIHTDRYDYVATVQKTADGTFQADIAAANIKTTGKYCQ